MRKRELLNKFTVLVKVILVLTSILPRGFFIWLYKFIRGSDGYLFIFLRYIILKRCCKSCGDNVAVFSNVYLFNLSSLEIGNNVSIHPLCYINASGGIKLGDNVSIAHNSTIMSEEHNFDNGNLNIKDQGCRFKSVSISNNVWIGAGVRILAGVKIESNSIVAAGAVVKKDVLQNSIVGGVPAKLIKKRI
jgi:acetyltransferase-like isoleucine patch superfamily enzyme